MRKVFLLSFPLVFLSSCLNPYNSDFSCPMMGQGVCDSIPNVYKMYKRGELPSERKEKQNRESTKAVIFLGKCVQKTVCNETCDCRKILVCKPDSVTNYIDFRAEAVKDNIPEVAK